MLPEICVRFFGKSRISARSVTLLPEPDSQAEDFPLAECEAEIVDRVDGALAGEADVEIVDFDEVAHAISIAGHRA
jgi:hypothetical protein